MTKEEAKAKLRKAESDLRMLNAVLKMHGQEVQEIKEEIAKLEAIINKPDRWQDGLVQPEKEKYFYLISSVDDGLIVGLNSESVLKPKGVRKPEHAFRTKEQAESIKEKILLMQEMYAFAHVKNEGWMPDWRNGEQTKYGIASKGDGIKVDWCAYDNAFVFGVVVKSIEIAGEILEMFGERIEKFYNKMY